MYKLLHMRADANGNAGAVEKLQEVINQYNLIDISLYINRTIQAIIHSSKGHTWNLWSYINYNHHFLYITSAYSKSDAILLAKVVYTDDF